MHREPVPAADVEGLHRPHASAALVVSVQSVVWTLLSSTVAIVLGLQSQTAVLVAFGSIGYVDAVGSMALVHHFRHGLRHDELSDDIEKLAHRVVLIGLLLVGCAALVGGVVRLALSATSEAPNSAVELASVSLVALTVLSLRKRSIARLVSSNALRSDAHLSAVGATQAAVAVAGTGVARWLGWSWADAAATAVVGCVAVAVGVATWRAHGRV